jgi:mycothiol synthase
VAALSQTSSLEDELAVRPAADDDAGQLARFIDACTLAYQGVSRSSESDVLERLHEYGSAPERDSFVISSKEGEIVGFAHVWRADEDEVRLFARTHPEAVGRNVGARLLELCEARARMLCAQDLNTAGKKRLTTTSWARDVRAPSLLERSGFAPIRHFLKMEIAADEVTDSSPPWPGGVELRLLAKDGSDEQPLYEAWLDAFAGHFGPASPDLAAFWHERREARREGPFRFDPSLWWIATDFGRIVGFSLCSESTADESQVGRIAEIGVLPRWRARGLGYAMLLHSFRELKQRGAKTIVLDVDAENVTSALRLYVKAGMSPRPAFTIWELALETSSA